MTDEPRFLYRDEASEPLGDHLIRHSFPNWNHKTPNGLVPISHIIECVKCGNNWPGESTDWALRCPCKVGTDPHDHHLIPRTQRGRLIDAAPEMLTILKEFPGHQTEDSWYNWIARKNAIIAKIEG